MKQLYIDYLNLLFHPEENNLPQGIKVYDSILLSWPAVIMGAFFELIFFFIILLFVDQISFTILENIELSLALPVLPIIYFVLRLVFSIFAYPFECLIFYALWKVILGLFGWFLKEDLSLKIEEVVASAIGSSIFRVIPIFGPVMSFFFRHFILFLGLRHSFKFTPLASFLVIVTPLFFTLITLFLLFFAISILFI